MLIWQVISDEEIEFVTNKTKNFTGSDIEDLVAQSASLAMHRLEGKRNPSLTNLERIPKFSKVLTKSNEEPGKLSLKPHKRLEILFQQY